MSLSGGFILGSINQTHALNFMLGALGVHLKRGNDITTENLIEVLESALRFSKIR
ncbi:hypothetical protein OKW24_005714 [Peribacillus simplex]|nr:hypothetical protein [Peribacillus simplex]